MYNNKNQYLNYCKGEIMASIINMLVKLEGRGEGVLKEFNGDSVVVRFGDEDVIMNFPQAFSEGLSAVAPENKARVGQLIEWWNWGSSASSEEKQLRVKAVVMGTAAPMLETTEAVLLYEKRKQAAAEALEKERRKNEERKREEQINKHEYSAKSTVKSNSGSASLTVGIILAVLSLAGLVCIPIGAGMQIIPLYIVGLASFLILGFIAHLIFLKNSSENVASKIFFYTSFFSYYILFVFVVAMLCAITFIIKCFKDDFGGFDLRGSKTEKEWIVPEGSYNRILKETGEIKLIDGRRHKRYRDNVGQFWLSADEEHFIKEGK